jgi:hypothetical protein
MVVQSFASCPVNILLLVASLWIAHFPTPFRNTPGFTWMEKPATRPRVSILELSESRLTLHIDLCCPQRGNDKAFAQKPPFFTRPKIAQSTYQNCTLAYFGGDENKLHRTEPYHVHLSTKLNENIIIFVTE